MNIHIDWMNMCIPIYVIYHASTWLVGWLYWALIEKYRENFGYGLSQWESILHGNVVSHWLSTGYLVHENWGYSRNVGVFHLYSCRNRMTFGFSQIFVLCFLLRHVITSSWRQNGQNFADHFCKWILVNEKFYMIIQIFLKFVPEGPIDNKPVLVGWR